MGKVRTGRKMEKMEQKVRGRKEGISGLEDQSSVASRMVHALDNSYGVEFIPTTWLGSASVTLLAFQPLPWARP